MNSYTIEYNDIDDRDFHYYGSVLAETVEEALIKFAEINECEISSISCHSWQSVEEIKKEKEQLAEMARLHNEAILNRMLAEGTYETYKAIYSQSIQDMLKQTESIQNSKQAKIIKLNKNICK